MSWGYYQQHESPEEKREKAQKQIAKLRKKGLQVTPVEIKKNTIATSWWGKAWNNNIESYADLFIRLERGRSYVRSGCVVDLKINKGVVRSMVISSGDEVYICIIKIKPLTEEKWRKILEHVGNRFSSLSKLLMGAFPKDLAGILSEKKEGLFPHPNEIKMICTCPDRAGLCKHLAAALYGVGHRLDTNPELLFTLRGIDAGDLISKVVDDHKDNLIEKASQVQSARVMRMKKENLAKLFGIDFA